MLKPCPFCGDIPDINDPDVLYPVGGEINMEFDPITREVIYTLYQLHCNKGGVGCGASMLGDTKEDCINRWNNRYA